MVSMKFKPTKNQWIFAVVFFLIYNLYNVFVVGFKTDHLIISLVLSFGSLIFRDFYKLVLGLSAFIIFMILYDGMQFCPNYEVSPIRFMEPYDIEISLFGIEQDGKIISPNEYLVTRTNDFLSFILGFAYLMWMPVPLLFSIVLYFKNKQLLLDYSYAFLFVNLVGFVGYYLYPAAPPWYLALCGAEYTDQMVGSAALLSEFDRIVGIPIFDSIYNRGANVYAAVPSLHSAFPLITLYYAWKWGYKTGIVAFSLLAVGTWVAAVYSQHHYVIDIILGIFVAIISQGLYEGLGAKKLFNPITNWVRREHGML
jgi:hypothetical protein